MQTVKRVSLVALILLFIFIVLVAIKYPEQKSKQAKLDYEVQSPEEQILKFAELIEEDRKALETVEFFRGSKGTKDAGPFLNPLVNWDGKMPSKLELAKELTHQLKDKNWVALEPNFKDYELDFSWMAKLHEFDHWSADQNNPLIDPAAKPMLQDLPFPGYMELTNWAKLRLIHGRKTQTMMQALADVRQLARLIYTNDYLVSSMVAVAFLRNENAFIQIYNPKIFSGWKTIPEETLVRARRYFWALPELVDPRLSDETYERFVGSNVGQCQMISEGMMKNLIVRDHLKKVYPAVVKRFDTTVKNSLNSCRKSLVHEMWNDPQWTVFGKDIQYEKSLVKPENESDWKWKLLMINPRVEELFAFSMMSIATPNYLKHYQEVATKSE